VIDLGRRAWRCRGCTQWTDRRADLGVCDWLTASMNEEEPVMLYVEAAWVGAGPYRVLTHADFGCLSFCPKSIQVIL